ncbi:MAG: hypothetical protein ACKOYN_01145 [Planctomycetota bacterium]
MSAAHAAYRDASAADVAAQVRAHFLGAGDTRFAGEALAQWRRATRLELGLPTDRPIVMTGHQAGVWHAGIAEKFLFGAEIAARAGAALVHVVVDHDLNDASLVAYPALVAGRLARLALERSPRGAGPNALRRPVRTMRSERAHEVPVEIEPALARIESAVAAERGRANLAMQMAHAANALLGPSVPVSHTLGATQLARTTFADMLRARFEGSRAAYNAAVAGERIAPVAADEVPFWTLDAKAGTRAPLVGSAAPGALLAPRALALTAIARSAACDLFIHGTGGARYDRAMEAWMSSVLGAPARGTLAPMAVATATRLAPLARFVPAFDPAATPDALRALEQDPFGDDGRTKRALRAAIAGTRAEKRAAFVSMRRAIERARAERATELNALRARVAANRDASAAHALATDRTWPFPFTMPRA